MPVPVCDTLAVPDPLPEGVTELLGVIVCVCVLVGVLEGVAAPLDVALGVCDCDAVTEGDTEMDGEHTVLRPTTQTPRKASDTSVMPPSGDEKAAMAVAKPETGTPPHPDRSTVSCHETPAADVKARKKYCEAIVSAAKDAGRLSVMYEDAFMTITSTSVDATGRPCGRNCDESAT